MAAPFSGLYGVASGGRHSHAFAFLLAFERGLWPLVVHFRFIFSVCDLTHRIVFNVVGRGMWKRPLAQIFCKNVVFNLVFQRSVQVTAPTNGDVRSAQLLEAAVLVRWRPLCHVQVCEIVTCLFYPNSFFAYWFVSTTMSAAGPLRFSTTLQNEDMGSGKGPTSTFNGLCFLNKHSSRRRFLN